MEYTDYGLDQETGACVIIVCTTVSGSGSLQS